MTAAPFVSILLVVKNGRAHIDRQLSELMQIEYPAEAYEVLVIDGMSKDGTADRVRVFERRFPGRIRLFSNPKGVLSAGWNIGIQNAKGDLVFRVDVHSALEPQYLRVCVRTLLWLEQSGVRVAAVGGRIYMTAAGDGKWQRAIAAAWNSRMGTARPAYRCAQRSGFVDAVLLAVFRKSVFGTAGLLDERLGRTEDNELFHRLQARSYKLYLTCETKAAFYVRARLRDLFRQMFGNGHWLLPTIAAARKNVFSLRHFVPGIALLTGTLLFISGARGWWALIVLAFSYLLGLGWSALTAGRTHRADAMAVACSMGCMHLAYGLGTWWGGLELLLGGVRAHGRGQSGMRNG